MPLHRQRRDADEFAGLGRARLANAQSDWPALASRFDLAYNAAHGLCLAVLRWHGYRSTRRDIVFELLPHTLSLGPEVWHVPARCHDLCCRGEYESDLNIDDRIVTDLIAACDAAG